MLRHRLLDVRVAIRKTLAYILTLILFGAPIVVLYALLRTSLETSRNIEITISTGILAVIIFLSPAVLRWTNKLSSRLFFTGLYDEVELLHQTSIIFSSTVDIKTGLIGSASLLCEKLKLQELLSAIPNKVTQQEGNWLIGSVRKEGLVEGFQETNSNSSPLYQLWSPITIDDRNEDEETLLILAEMREQGIEACLPIAGPTGKLGVLLIGEKLNRANLDPLDLDLLTQFTEQAGLFLENYLLSTYLLVQLEELLRTRSELQKADQFKTDIINVTSHELRTPLTVLNSFTQILLKRYKRCNEAQRIEYLGYVSESCQRLNTIFNQFLSVSNLQEGQIEISPQALSLSPLFNEVCDSFGPEDNSRIKIDITPSAIEVQSDHFYLSLMLKNLIENAIRFSSPEFPVVLSVEKNGNEAVISVSDSGEGIDAPEVQRIFSPFIRLENTDQHHTGTGLGLYLVRLIAELLGTSINVESQPNQGSLFRFSLPLTASEDVSERV